MPHPSVESVAVPADSLVARAFPRSDYADAFAIGLAPGSPERIEDLARAAFAGVPGWIDRLMRLRNALVRPFGLKTAYDPAAVSVSGPLAPGMRVGIFHVYDVNEREVLMGEDDRHLDFRVSVLEERTPEGRRAVVTTVVRYNGRLGRLYFAVVRPFHRLVVPAILRRNLASGC